MEAFNFLKHLKNTFRLISWAEYQHKTCILCVCHIIIFFSYPGNNGFIREKNCLVGHYPGRSDNIFALA
ncbi:hypothetical protein HK11_12040 [Acetobacter sp. DmW_043]|nr:hypothetical protein HK11_12040 [Acetobacter sp. DmW_043]